MFRLKTAGKYFLRTAAAAVLGSSLLLMIDNFTVTLFAFGIRSLQFPQTIVYIALAAFLYVVSYRWIVRTENNIAGKLSGKSLSIAVYAILLVAFMLVLNRYVTASSSLREYRSVSDSSLKRPNILMIGSDGINADHMSIYGYEKITTPFLSRFAEDSLICWNAYANASRTLASLVSMLSGRHPTDTRITCPPDILRGEDGYRHLPGILKRHGYRSIQLTVRDYGDALDANMRMAFDIVNFRRADELALFELTGPFLDQESAYLVHQSYDRLSQRILHIFGLRKMPDSLAEVLGQKRETFPDSERVKKLIEFIDASREPFFAHVHFMSTHKNRIKSPSKSEAALIGP
ncbi:MAG TPA: sulfatase-like hydrolase/transferase, partial [Acidobacteriota bacterium]